MVYNISAAKRRARKCLRVSYAYFKHFHKTQTADMIAEAVYLAIFAWCTALAIGTKA